MKFSTVPCLLAALFSATSVLAEALQEPAATAVADQPQQTTAPEVFDEEGNKLDLRQVAGNVNVGATAAPVAPPSITTQWLPTEVNGVTTYVEFIYTQTFAAIPDQWPSAGQGQIGYGTLTHKKRQAPVETGYVQSVVLEIQQEFVTQFVRPVTEVLVIETVTILPNMTWQSGYSTGYNGTNFNSTMIGNSTSLGNSTALGNVTARTTFPAFLDPMAHHGPTGTAVHLPPGIALI